MLDLALNHGKGLALLKDIAIRQNISLGYLEQIIPSLKSAGLVSSRRGAYGGYELAKPPSQITIKDIVNALAGPIFLIESGTASEGSYKSGQCVTMDIWNELSELINLTLSSQTLEDLVNKHNSRQKNTLSMYYI
jgi:Rrf2 family protein